MLIQDARPIELPAKSNVGRCITVTITGKETQTINLLLQQRLYKFGQLRYMYVDTYGQTAGLEAIEIVTDIGQRFNVQGGWQGYIPVYVPFVTQLTINANGPANIILFDFFLQIFSSENWTPSKIDYNKVVLADNPLAYWDMTESVGTFIADVSGNGHNGIATPTGITYGSATGAGIPGALLLNGSSGYVGVNYGAWMDPINKTLEAWVKPAIQLNNTGIIDRLYNNVGSIPYGLGGYNGAYSLGSYISIGSYNGSWSYVNSAASCTIGLWNYIVATIDAGNVLLYFNGDVIAAGTILYETNTTDLLLGRRHSLASGQSFFEGYFGPCAIYDHVLTASRIAAHYAAGK